MKCDEETFFVFNQFGFSIFEWKTLLFFSLSLIQIEFEKDKDTKESGDEVDEKEKVADNVAEMFKDGESSEKALSDDEEEEDEKNNTDSKSSSDDKKGKP